MKIRGSALLLALLVAPGFAAAADWASWRGPHQNGVSDETGLIATWSRDGENLVWRQDFTGRSTPVVLDGRVCANGRVGTEEGNDRRETVACFGGDDGKLLWQRYFSVSNTTVPFNRVSWAALTGDPATGYIYHQGAAGLFVCLDRDGKTVWSHKLHERFGRFSGYGGRTSTPIVFEDLVIVNVINASWGRLAKSTHRIYAFDKRTGDPVWISTPAGPDDDKNTYSNLVVASIAGRDMVVGGNADGAVYAVLARTGEKVWGFQLSQRGLNSSVAVDGDRVYAGHSEENVDAGTMGRVVCIDATGTGDVTKTHEVWRNDLLGVGNASPAIAGDRLLVVDNSGNLFSLDKATGKTIWTTNVGTVGKGSPVVADGKIYVTEVNGRFTILENGATEAKVLDTDHLTMADGRYAEIYGSPAIANGRIYFTTEEGLYCLGNKETKGVDATATPATPATPSTAAAVAAMKSSGAPAQSLLVVPAEVLIEPGRTARFEVRAYDASGRRTDPVEVAWTVDGLAGEIAADGTLTAAAATPFQVGQVQATAGKLTAVGRVRVLEGPPWSEDFEGFAVDAKIPYWLGAGRYAVVELDGNKVLAKPLVTSGLPRSPAQIGDSEWRNYTLQADVMGRKAGRRRGDVAIVNSGYTLDLMGSHQHIELRSWAAVMRMAKQVDFAWDPDVWYTMKLRVEPKGDKALVQGKVWARGTDEPTAWTIELNDAYPELSGTPMLLGNSTVEVYYDNVKVTVN